MLSTDLHRQGKSLATHSTVVVCRKRSSCPSARAARFSFVQYTKMMENAPNDQKHTKRSKNPNNYKIYRKSTKIFHSKSFRNIPKIVDLGIKIYHLAARSVGHRIIVFITSFKNSIKMTREEKKVDSWAAAEIHWNETNLLFFRDEKAALNINGRAQLQGDRMSFL
jgi:hypothetical protein